MIESTLPRWSVRLDAKRPHGFSDLVPMVATHLRAHEAAQKFLGPYNARQRAAKHYMAPDASLLREMIRQGSMNDFSYAALINSLIRFCEQTKGQRGLPEPHPSRAAPFVRGRTVFVGRGRMPRRLRECAHGADLQGYL